MDVSAVYLGLANAANTIEGLNCYDIHPDRIEEPAFLPRSVDIEFDHAMNRGQDKFTVTAVVLVSRSDDGAGQAVINTYFKGAGATSLKAAIQADKTLGGACRTLRVTEAKVGRMITVGGVAYYGAELTIDIYGRGD